MPGTEFSIVIPTHDRRQTLAAVLASLGRLAYSRQRFEVLVVDDGSSDGTAELVADFPADYSLRLLRQEQAGAGAARNHGIRQARGGLCLFIDDDVLPACDLLSEHHESHRGHLKRLVRGPVINIPALPGPESPPPPWQTFSMNYLCTSNASLRRDLLFEAGLFDERFDRWEDAELGVRLKRIGVRRHFNHQAYVYHLKPPQEPPAVIRTAGRDGRSAARLYRRYPGLAMRLRTGLHPLNFLRSRLLTVGPLKRLYGRWIDQEPGSRKADFARALLAEQEYLRCGRDALRGEPGWT